MDYQIPRVKIWFMDCTGKISNTVKCYHDIRKGSNKNRGVVADCALLTT